MKWLRTSKLESSNHFITKVAWTAAESGLAVMAVVAKFAADSPQGVLWIEIALVIAVLGAVAYFARFAAGLDELLGRRHLELTQKLSQITGNHMTYIEFGGSAYYDRIHKTIADEIVASNNGIKPEVWLTSFRADSPLRLVSDSGKATDALREYHQHLQEWVVDGRITVRRIISVPTPNKLVWVEELVKTMARPGYEMRLVDGPTSEEESGGHSKDDRAYFPRVPPSLNVQLIGLDHVYLVVSAEKSRAGDKFIYVRSAALNAVLREHYSNLWNYLDGNALITEDHVHENNLDRLRKKFTPAAAA